MASMHETRPRLDAARSGIDIHCSRDHRSLSLVSSAVLRPKRRRWAGVPGGRRDQLLTLPQVVMASSGVQISVPVLMNGSTFSPLVSLSSAMMVSYPISYGRWPML